MGKKVASLLILAFLVGLVVWGCGQSQQLITSPEETPEAIQIVINNGGSSILRIPSGTMQTIEAIVKNSNGETLNNVNINWKVYGSIGYIDDYGTFRATHPGTGSVEASVGEVKAWLKVQVYQSLIVEAFNYINDNFLYSERIPDKFRTLYGVNLEAALLTEYSSVESFIKSLGDPYTRYVAPGEDKTDSILSGYSYGGVGILIGKKGDKVRILYVIPDGPAQKAGLHAGDLILEVDGISVSGLGISEVADLIRGTPDTSVQLKIQRGNEILEFDLIRKYLKVKNVYAEVIEGNIGYMKILQFGYDASSDFVKAYNSIGKDITGLIIDLRGNGGGELYSAINIVSQFVPDGKAIIWYKDRSGEMEKYESNEKLKIFLPVVLLVDEYTASAAEILTAALVEHDIATAVGVRTYGKGTVQSRYYLSDGSRIYITVAEYFSPTRQKIDGVGITPEVVVEITDEDLVSDNDSQLQAAIEELKKKQTAKAQAVGSQVVIFEKSVTLPKILEGVIDYQGEKNVGGI